MAHADEINGMTVFSIDIKKKKHQHDLRGRQQKKLHTECE